MKRTTVSPIGKIALVYPALMNDPSGNNGKVGKIVAYFPERQIVTLLLKDRSQPVYTAEKLLLLRSPKWLLKVLLSGLLDGNTSKALLQIYKLVKSKHRRKALMVAVSHESTIFYCVESCKDWITRHAH